MAGDRFGPRVSKWLSPHPALRRWLWVLNLAVVSAVVFEAVLPVGRTWLRRLPLPDWYSPWFLLLLAWVALTCLVVLVADSLRLHVRQFRYAHRYPPLWFAIILGVCLAAGVERLPAPYSPSLKNQEWQDTWLLAALLSAIVAGLFVGRCMSRVGAPARAPKQPKVPAPEQFDWKTLSHWLPLEEPASQDLFEHLPVARRIAGVLKGGRVEAVALLGGYGSGKSSILNWVRGELSGEKKPTDFVFVEIGGWAFRNPEDAPRVALRRIIDALEPLLDMQAFRGLPQNYQSLIAAEPLGLLKSILNPEPGEPEDELKRLTPLLEAAGLQLVLILEDVDRAGAGFDTRHLERLFLALRGVDRVSVIVSIDQTHTAIDYHKLCDVIELVPRISPDQVRRLLSRAYHHWLGDWSFIDTVPDRLRQDRLTLANGDDEVLRYLHAISRDTPVDAITTLLKTPRRLKHFIRNVESTWSDLAGEIDLEDLIVLTALREGAPDVHAFLVDQIDTARHKPDEFATGTQTVKAAWDKVLESTPHPDSVIALVDTLGILQLRSGKGIGPAEAPQGVRHGEPVDYFRRVLARTLAPGQVRDQEVLSDIPRWKASSDGSMFERLSVRTEPSDQYLRVWEHFAYNFSDAELLQLADELIELELRDNGAASAIDRPGLLSVWRRCMAQLSYDSYAPWLAATVNRVLGVSLHFANDLFSYFSSEKVARLSPEKRLEVRKSFVQAVQATVTSPGALLSRLSAQHPHALYRLILGPHGERLEPLRDWTWLGRIIADAVKQDPGAMAPHLVSLVSEFNHRALDPLNQGERAPQHLLDLERVKLLFGGDWRDVLQVVSVAKGEGYVEEVAAQAAGARQT